MRTPEPVEGRWIDIRQASTYTGLAISTLYTMVSQRRIPFVKMGRRPKRGTLRRLEAVKRNHAPAGKSF